MAKLSHDEKKRVYINNIPLEECSFSNIKKNLHHISANIRKNNKELKNFDLIKSKINILKANIKNENLSDSDFREFVSTLF